MKFFKVFVLVGVVIFCFSYLQNASAGELDITESMINRMLEIGIKQFDIVKPQLEKVSFDYRMYFKTFTQSFLITGKIDKKKKEILIEVSELVQEVLPGKDIQKRIKKSLRNDEFFDLKSMRIAKKLFTEKGKLNKAGVYVFKTLYAAKKEFKNRDYVFKK